MRWIKEDEKRVSDNFNHMAGSKGESDKSRFSSATRVRKIGSAQDCPLDSFLILTLYSKSILNTVSQSFLKTFTTEDLVIKSSNITLLILFFLLIIFLFDNVLTLWGEITYQSLMWVYELSLSYLCNSFIL